MDTLFHAAQKVEWSAETDRQRCLKVGAASCSRAEPQAAAIVSACRIGMDRRAGMDYFAYLHAGPDSEANDDDFVKVRAFRTRKVLQSVQNRLFYGSVNDG